jgi:hypothetical protein
VFHVSLLKLCKGEPTTQITPLEDPSNYPPIVPILEAIINRRPAADGNEEILIQWKDLPQSEATWMDKNAYQEQFPNLNLEDKIHFDGVSNDTQQEEGINIRPKRTTKRPKRYED